MKKFVLVSSVFILAFILVLPVFSGGGAQRTPVPTLGPYQRDPNLNPPGTLPINRQTVSLRIAVEQNGQITDWKTNWQTQLLERQGNYDLNFDVYPAGTMNQRLELMVMAGGTDLPDALMSRSFNLAAVTRYGQAGMILPLNTYYENSAYHIDQMIQQYPTDPRMYITSYDGNIYGVLYATRGQNSEHNQQRIMMYEPWLQRLGLDKPETINEFINVLRAFRDRDPNGNGLRDEIPLIAHRDIMNTRFLVTLMQPFIYTQPNYWMLNDGRIDVSFNKPGWRDGLRYIQQLLDEDLLSPLSFTQDQTQMTALISPDPARVGAVIRDSSSNLGVNDRKRTEYIVAGPLEGPAGKNNLYWPEIPVLCLLITKNCSNPESAFLLGDLLCGEEMSIISRYGEPGVDWIEPQYPNNISIIEGITIWVQDVNLIWGTPHNKHWASAGPRMMSTRHMFNDIAGANPNDPFDWNVPSARNIQKEMSLATTNPITGLTYSEQEQDIMNQYHSTILTYVQESYARFVTGDLSLDRNWDAYVAEFNRMGLTDVIRATQSAWDRLNSRR